MEEIWMPITGYEGHYEVSSFGRVKSLARRVRHRSEKGFPIPEKVLTPGVRGGYPYVNLCLNGVHTSTKVHRLVAKAFLMADDTRPNVNHKDGVRSNNRWDNLEWCTQSENVQHSYDVLGQRAPHTGKIGKDSHNSIPVVKLDRQGNFISRHASAAEVYREEGICASGIAGCARGKLKTAGGFKWAYQQ